MMIHVFSAPADEGGPLDYAKEFLIQRNVQLESLTCVSKSASACYIQLFDTPRKMDIAISDSDVGDATYTLTTGHQFVNGDKVTLTGITGGPFTGYFRNVTATTFSLHNTRAEALAGTDAIAPPNDGETGTVELASVTASSPISEEYPLAAAADAPSNVLSLTNARFKRGLYVRAVTAQNGSTLISGDDIKFTPRYRTGPNANNVIVPED